MEYTVDSRSGSSIEDLLAVIERLRGENGCPWDRKQTLKSIAIYLVEESFELLNAIETEDPHSICEELGDVLFQVLFISYLLKEKGGCDIEGAAKKNAEKMIRRHPHVFAGEKIDSVSDVKKRWEEIKRDEKKDPSKGSLFESVPKGLPALLRAYRIGSRASTAGFDWTSIQDVWEKAKEEWREFESEAIKMPVEHQHEEKKNLEFRDVLFTLVNVARFAKIHPETALSAAIEKFEKRFRCMERMAMDRGVRFERLNRDEKEVLWNEAKEMVR